MARPIPLSIELRKYELLVIGIVGVARNVSSIDSPNAYGLEELTGWNKHINGAGGECACAKGLGRYWEPTINTFSRPDILCPDLGFDLQVRTRSRDDHELYVRPKDDPECGYVLITGTAPHFKLWGYRFGRDVRIEKWKQTYGDRPPAWFVPTDELWPWQDLKIGHTAAATPQPKITDDDRPF